MDSDYTFGTGSSHLLALELELGVVVLRTPRIVILLLPSCFRVILNQDAVVCPCLFDGKFPQSTFPALQFVYSHFSIFRGGVNLT